jgi:hypothetical protein
VRTWGVGRGLTAPWTIGTGSGYPGPRRLTKSPGCVPTGSAVSPPPDPFHMKRTILSLGILLALCGGLSAQPPAGSATNANESTFLTEIRQLTYEENARAKATSHPTARRWSSRANGNPRIRSTRSTSSIWSPGTPTASRPAPARRPARSSARARTKSCSHPRITIRRPCANRRRTPVPRHRPATPLLLGL